MKRLLPLLFIIFFVSCGQMKKIQGKFLKDSIRSNQSRQFNSTDPTFNALVEEFETEAREKLNDPDFSVGDIPINFGDTGKKENVGLCIFYSNGQKEIIINRNKWKEPSIRAVTIFHELGHCRLGRDKHLDDTLRVGQSQFKLSMMNSELLNSNTFSLHKDEYLIELFKKDVLPIKDSLLD